MPGFYMECYTELKWFKREYSLPQFLILVCQKFSNEVLLTGPKIHAKVTIHSGACFLGEGQLCAFPLMVKG